MTDFPPRARFVALPFRRPRTRRAMTMIELLVAISIASIMLAAALPRINLAGYRLDAAMRVAYGAVQQAHRSAIQRQHDVVLSFDTASAQMRVLYDANNNRGRDAGEQLSLVSLQDGNRFDVPSSGIRSVPTAAINGPNLATVDGLPSVIFRRDGATSSELEVYLRAPGSGSRDFRALAVVQSTGRVQRYRYNGTVWREEGR